LAGKGRFEVEWLEGRMWDFIPPELEALPSAEQKRKYFSNLVKGTV
jgi:hypothetical protein